MQIQRFEHEPHILGDSQGNRQVSASGVVLQGTHSKAADTSTADWNLSPLLNRLRQHPEVRVDAIEVARQKVARGDYLTPASAAELAGSDLRFEFFTPRP